jgi:colicin import membrane protein
MAELQADGVFEEAEGNIRQQLMAAAQLARSAVQARQDAAQRATRRDLEQARQLQAQLDAQRAAARAELAPVHESSWWDQAQVRDVARAYETAVTFRDEDQAARDAEARIRQELRDRYDVEVLETGADPAVVRATLVDRDTERAERDERQAQARDDQDLAAGLVVGAEVLEVSADLADAEEAQDLRDLAADVEHDAELSWDSAERRELHFEGIKTRPDQAAAATAWKQADVDQARHPREAVQGGRKGKSSRTRVPASTPDRQIGRDGR